MKVQFQVKCECEKQFPVQCRKPNYVTHIIVNTQCPLCESKFILGVKRVFTKEVPLRMSIETRRFIPSALFLEGQLAAIAEQAELDSQSDSNHEAATKLLNEEIQKAE